MWSQNFEMASSFFALENSNDFWGVKVHKLNIIICLKYQAPNQKTETFVFYKIYYFCLLQKNHILIRFLELSIDTSILFTKKNWHSSSLKIVYDFQGGNSECEAVPLAAGVCVNCLILSLVAHNTVRMMALAAKFRFTIWCHKEIPGQSLWYHWGKK